MLTPSCVYTSCQRCSGASTSVSSLCCADCRGRGRTGGQAGQQPAVLLGMPRCRAAAAGLLAASAPARRAAGAQCILSSRQLDPCMPTCIARVTPSALKPSPPTLLPLAAPPAATAVSSYRRGSGASIVDFIELACRQAGRIKWVGRLAGVLANEPAGQHSSKRDRAHQPCLAHTAGSPTRHGKVAGTLCRPQSWPAKGGSSQVKAYPIHVGGRHGADGRFAAFQLGDKLSGLPLHHTAT